MTLSLSLLSFSTFLVIVSSLDSYISPEETAAVVFTGADFIPPCNFAPVPNNRTAIRKNAIATRMQVHHKNVN
jgi:hypothetical protein